VVDQAGYNQIVQGAKTVQNYVSNNQWAQATNAWGNLEGTIGSVTQGVDFYNILYKINGRKQNKMFESPIGKRISKLFRVSCLIVNVGLRIQT